VIGTDCICSFKSNYHTIKATTAPLIYLDNIPVYQHPSTCVTCWSFNTYIRCHYKLLKQNSNNSNQELSEVHDSFVLCWCCIPLMWLPIWYLQTFLVLTDINISSNNKNYFMCYKLLLLCRLGYCNWICIVTN